MTSYIDLFYVQQIIKSPHAIAVLASPASIVGGWFVDYPRLKKGGEKHEN